MHLTLSKSTIRSFRTTDAASIAKHCGAYSVARNLAALPHPYTLQHAEEWIAIATSASSPETHFAIAIDDEVVGVIGITLGDPQRRGVCDHCAEIGYWLGESFWGRGIMSEAVAALTEWAFAELGLVRLHLRRVRPQPRLRSCTRASWLHLRRATARPLLPRRRIHLTGCSTAEGPSAAARWSRI